MQFNELACIEAILVYGKIR